MRAVVIRVSRAGITINGNPGGNIGRGFLVLVGICEGDGPEESAYLAKKCTELRVFEDENGKMNKSVTDVGGSLLVVSQFTLAADTAKGLRPSFTPAAAPDEGRRLYELFVQHVKASGLNTQTGEFGADMKVALINDGPVTFWLKV